MIPPQPTQTRKFDAKGALGLLLQLAVSSVGGCKEKGPNHVPLLHRVIHFLGAMPRASQFLEFSPHHFLMPIVP